MRTTKKRTGHVSYAKPYIPGEDRKVDLKNAGGMEEMLRRHNIGRILLSDEFIEELKQRIFELRFPWGESGMLHGCAIPLEEHDERRKKMNESPLFPAK